MRNFIIKKFVKNPDDVKNPETRESYGSVAGIVGIISNLILCIFKIITGAVFGSIAILADGINNLADASASVITLVGFKLAARKPDKNHPYGHGRTEYLTSLIISAMILAIGISLFKSSLEKTLHPDELEFSVLTIVVLIAAILIKLWQTGFNMAIGKIINSEALLATGADSRNDVISTSAVLVSVIIGKFTGINLDGPVGIVVAIFIIFAGIGLVKESVAPILGQAPDPQLVKDIASCVKNSEGVLGIHDLIIHDYGPGRLFASCHAEVDSREDIFLTHDRIDNIERDVYNRLGVLLTIHMDPVDTKDPMTSKAKDILGKIIFEIPGLINFHDVRTVSGPTHINVVFDVVADYDCKLSDAEIKEAIQEKLSRIDPKMISVVTIDRNYC